MIISSQRYRDDEIIAAKIADEDFEVSLSPKFTIDGETYQAIIDGHHSLEAARLAGVDPEFVELDVSDADTIWLLIDGQIDDYLTVAHIDSPWYNVDDGQEVW